MENNKDIVSSNLRLVAIMNDDRQIKIKFSDDKKLSHRNLWDAIKHADDFKRNYDIPIYGRFYSLISGNSFTPTLIIYGTSSDYRLENVGHYETYYENAIREFAYTSKWNLIFLS